MTSWTAPRTWTAYETVTTSILNTHIRDNELHLKETATDHESRIVVLEGMDRCSVTNSIDIATSGLTTITFDTEVRDSNGMHSTVTNTERITIQTDGDYLVSWRVAFSSGNSQRYVQLLKNAGASIEALEQRVSATGTEYPNGVAFLPGLVVGDYLYLKANAGGGAGTVKALTNYSPFFSVLQVSL